MDKDPPILVSDNRPFKYQLTIKERSVNKNLKKIRVKKLENFMDKEQIE